ncbi:ATP-binding protein [Mesorhizobium sp. M0199]|uniref:ATP-binding protein n=1 Tax=Mesorhizobium sp. M0199 TaxID=2956911 RepID=UPI0033365D78
MTGGIAHDFRNLLAVIESGLGLAERRADEPERVRAYIAAAREGIDRVLRKVFDPFFTTKGEKGTGIGMPQVQALTQRVGGRIRIKSERGIGTTVDLLFPSVPSDI